MGAPSQSIVLPIVLRQNIEKLRILAIAIDHRSGLYMGRYMIDETLDKIAARVFGS